jgi:16S rRNA (cytidine1402-2'-O)-methyltransferase
MGTLYIVSTPIGNLKDITLRALEVLKMVDLIASEDTRHAGILLAHYQIKKSLLSYQEFDEAKRIPQIIEKLKSGQNVALVSDAGTPTLSDPGFRLVRECINQKIPVVSIPGPSAILAALVSSGLPTDKFLFLGYLPKKQGKRKALLQSLSSILQSIKVTLVIFESPHKVLKSLNDLKEVFGDIDIVIARELTKIHEEVRREKISQSIKHFQKEKPRGEFTILF